MGMANATPWNPPLRQKICELMPTTSPSRLNSGPPELPGFTAASVWMKPTTPSPGSERDLALTMPEVTVLSRPNGVPIATTQSPTRVFAGSPRRTTGRSFASILSTATSVAASLPSTFARNSRWSVSLTMTSSASATTCAFVSTMPFLLDDEARAHAAGRAGLRRAALAGHAAEERGELGRQLRHRLGVHRHPARLARRTDLHDGRALLLDQVGERGQRALGSAGAGRRRDGGRRGRRGRLGQDAFGGHGAQAQGAHEGQRHRGPSEGSRRSHVLMSFR